MPFCFWAVGALPPRPPKYFRQEDGSVAFAKEPGTHFVVDGNLIFGVVIAGFDDHAGLAQKIAAIRGQVAQVQFFAKFDVFRGQAFDGGEG